MLYSDQVESQSGWKTDHDDAMACMEFECILKFGMSLFDGIVALDEKLREAALSQGSVDETLNTLIGEMDLLVEWWLKPCKQVEAEIKRFSRLGYAVDGAEEFRKRHAEAKWILEDAESAFGDQRMVELRDAAIDDLRKGNTSPVE